MVLEILLSPERNLPDLLPVPKGNRFSPFLITTLHVLKSNTMRHFTSLFFFALTASFLGCNSVHKDRNNAIPFIIGDEEPCIIAKVILNGETEANLSFDSGARSVYLDSSFCARNNLFKESQQMKPETSAWSAAIRFNAVNVMDTLKIAVDSREVVYDYFQIWSNLTAFYSRGSNWEGIFGIPVQDSTNVWEINFDDNLLRIAPADDFPFPKQVKFFPLSTVKEYDLTVKMPVNITLADGAKIVSNWECLIDTGLKHDIVLLHNAPEKEALDKRNDAAWFSDSGGMYRRRFNTSAEVFDSYKLDTLMLYTLQTRTRIKDINYVLGLNFLKHFNLFFDMKNHRLGLVPVRKYVRLYNYAPYYCGVYTNEEGKFEMYHIADYKDNPYKKAGLQVGDEVLEIDGFKMEDIVNGKVKADFFGKDTISYRIRRERKEYDFTFSLEHDKEIKD